MRPAPVWALGATLVAGALGACGDDSAEDTGPAAASTGTEATSTGGTPSSGATGDGGQGQGAQGPGQGGAGGQGGGQGGQGGEGGSPPVNTCDLSAPHPTRGSAIAISPDDTTIVSVNRDVGSVTVTRASIEAGVPALSLVAELDLGAGSEPWQVAMNACGTRAYVVLRNEQRVVEIVDLDTDTPAIGDSAAVGSEPTSVAISPGNSRLYVANWVEGTVTVVATGDMAVEDTIDLNTTLAASGLIGDVAARPALAHPRAIAITNDGDLDDDDEQVVVTEWYGQRTAPESDDGKNSDVNKKGLLYVIDTASNAVSAVDLPPILDTGLNNRLNQVTGCFPNQVSSVTVEGSRAFVTSTCASPVGPSGVFAPAAAVCTVLTQATDCGLDGTCNANTLTCNPNPRDAKTSTHPSLHVIDLESGDTIDAEALDARFHAPAVASARMPHLPTDIGFFNGFAYVAAMGADALFRVTIAADGTIEAVGSSNNDFIDLRTGANDTLIRLPIGVATAQGNDAFAFVANDGSRDVTAVAFNTQAIAGLPDDAVILQAADLPLPGSADEDRLRGKRFFTTGLGRWSLAGQAWGSCAACHIDGLTDNVTWYFGRGPRQSTSLDGSFDSANGDDQRIFNWTAVFDEVADFELNTRGVSGGLGAIVDAGGARINLGAQSPPQHGLAGSTADAADPQGPSGGAHPHSVLDDWQEVTEYVKSIRSPRAPVGLVAADVDAGRELFTSTSQGNCVGCHSGGKWTISTRFYEPGDVPNGANGVTTADMLEGTSWNTALNGFPTALLPAGQATIDAGNAKMRFGTFPGTEQIQCILRPVGTIELLGGVVTGVSPAAVNVRELRQDMTTPGQGAADTGRGFNPPSLLGLQTGAPFFHAGNARSLEEVFDELFEGHHQSAIASVFNPSDTQKRQLVAFLLSIDESTDSEGIPAKGENGGDLCFAP